MEQRLIRELDEAVPNAIGSIGHYKFAMFGYLAGIWVHLNRINNANRPNPFKRLVTLAMEMGKLVVLALATSLLLASSLNAQPSNDALKALKKIDATVSMGVNFTDYGRLMAESNYTMQEYLSKPTKNKPLDKSIKDAWDLYVLAKRAWTNISGRPARYVNPGPEYDALMKISGMRQAVMGGGIVVELALPLIWSDASKKVKLASQLAEISKEVAE
jgi:hypothetical protein